MLRRSAPETQLCAAASQHVCTHSAAPLKHSVQPTISISAVAGATSAAAPATAAKPLPDLKSIKGVLFDIDGETLSYHVTPLRVADVSLPASTLAASCKSTSAALVSLMPVPACLTSACASC
jgi:hypothetical protein